MAEPITKVYDAEGRLVHSCPEAGCEVSWDGYVLTDGHVVEQADAADPASVTRTPLAKGKRVPNGADPGRQWDVSVPGVARLRAKAG